MEHKRLTIVLLVILFNDITNGRTKDPDEDRAYEFGFTIEGMQHRHEKKDVNGIIQGEFGFITADGVYHVTVYATDENGNFRILSMKNIKVSPPLDGSPDYGSQKYSSIPQGNQSSSLKPVQIQKRTDASTTRAPNKAFTTQPTLKPACAGCGYVTTSKRPPLSSGQPQQGPPFDSSRPGAPGAPGASLGSIGGNQKTAQEYNGFSTSQRQGGGGGSGLNPQVPQISTGIQKEGLNGLVPPSVGDLPNGDSNSRASSTSSDPGNLPPSLSSYSDSFSNPQNSQSDSFGPTKDNKHSSQITYRNPDPPVEVTGGVIKVPGNPDIPIKDKYPGMVEGLPAGIEEKDITDILYRFNWTVGFQGHYETGYKNGAKIGGYFVNGSDGISRVVTYVADEFGYRPKVRLINIGLDSPDTPKDDKTFELKSFEFVWYPVK